MALGGQHTAPVVTELEPPCPCLGWRRSCQPLFVGFGCRKMPHGKRCRNPGPRCSSLTVLLCPHEPAVPRSFVTLCICTHANLHFPGRNLIICPGVTTSLPAPGRALCLFVLPSMQNQNKKKDPVLFVRRPAGREALLGGARSIPTVPDRRKAGHVDGDGAALHLLVTPYSSLRGAACSVRFASAASVPPAVPGVPATSSPSSTEGRRDRCLCQGRAGLAWWG